MNYISKLKALIASKDPRAIEAVAKSNAALLHIKQITPGTVHVDSALSNVSIQYRNEDFIGLQLMPLVTVDKLSNQFFKYGKQDRLAAPDDSITTRSTPNEVSETRTTDNYSCKPYALMDFLDDLTMRNQDAPLNEMVDLVASVNDAIDLREELRIAAILGSSSTFPSSNVVTLTGADQFNSSTGGDPIGVFQTAVDSLYMGNGPSEVVAYGGPEAIRALQRNPRLLDALKYTTPGAQIPLDKLAMLLGVDRVLIGKARQDTQNVNQTPSNSRIWGKYVGVIRVAKSPGIRQASFGYTFRFGQKTTTQWYEPKPGMSGGYYSKVGLAEDHKVVASDTGYFIASAVS